MDFFSSIPEVVISSFVGIAIFSWLIVPVIYGAYFYFSIKKKEVIGYQNILAILKDIKMIIKCAAGLSLIVSFLLSMAISFVVVGEIKYIWLSFVFWIPSLIIVVFLAILTKKTGFLLPKEYKYLRY